MNCLDCRRRLLTEPDVRDSYLRAHLGGCSACARFAGEQTAFERRLEAALRVPAPENLREQIIFRASMRRRRPGRCLAAAAVLMLGVALGLGGWEYTATQRLANDMVLHMAHDPLHERPSDTLAAPQLTRLTTALGTYLDTTGMGEVVQARWCEIDGRRGAHFVIERSGRRATAFLLPDVRLAVEHRVQVGDMHGVLIPTDRGLVAVFCPDRQMLTRLVEDMRQSARWLA